MMMAWRAVIDGCPHEQRANSNGMALEFVRVLISALGSDVVIGGKRLTLKTAINVTCLLGLSSFLDFD